LRGHIPDATADLALDHGIDPGAPAEQYQVVVHVDALVLVDPNQPGQSVLEHGAHVPAGTSRRPACDASRVVMRHDPDGHVVEVGARPERFRPRCGAPSCIAPAAVASRAAASGSFRAITGVTGPKADDHVLPTTNAGTVDTSSRPCYTRVSPCRDLA
jgi:hypothetical protein